MPINPVHAPVPYDGQAIASRILENDELVMRILESARQPGPPMSLDEFMDWLKTG